MEFKDEEAVLSHLTCPVCNEYLYPPIKQCSKGHSFCNKCSKDITYCPICQVFVARASRNITLENVLSELKIPCRYKSCGCNIVDTIVKIRAHQEFCSYGQTHCPLNEFCKCSWVGNFEDLLKHTRKLHNSKGDNNVPGRYLKNIFLPVDRLDEDYEHIGLIDAYGKLFKYGLKINLGTNKIWLFVQFVGPREEVLDYSFVIRMTDWDCVTASACQPLVIDSYNSFWSSASPIYIAGLSEFCANHKGLKLEVEILHTKDLHCYPLKRKYLDDYNETNPKRKKKLKRSADKNIS